MWRWDADLKAAVHESRSACKQVRKDTENGHKMKKTAKKRQKIIIGHFLMPNSKQRSKNQVRPVNK
jgi:hypothetical protein